MKNWYESKTLWLNFFLASGAMIEANFGLLRDRMSPESYLTAIAIFAGINAVLRLVTSKPIQ